MQRRGSCPSCNLGLSVADTAELKETQPLAFRLLGRVRVRCAAPRCSWTGDYSSLSGHLMSTDTHRAGANTATGGVSAADEAEALKEAGNERLRARAFPEALKLYSKAISLQQHPTYYCNRAAAWLAVGAPREAVADCRAALLLQPDHAKAYARLAKALCEGGDPEAALAHLDSPAAAAVPSAELTAARAEADELAQLLRLGASASATGDGATACAALEAARSRCGAPSLTLALARAELARGGADRASRLALSLLRVDASNAEALAVRGAAALQSGEFEAAAAALRHALRLAPDDGLAAASFRATRRAAAAVEFARAAVFSRDFERAVTDFGAAMDAAPMPPAAPLRTTLLCERAAARLRLKDYAACLADCEAALAGSDDSRQSKGAYLTRAGCLRAMGQPAEALTSLRAALEMDPGDVRLKADADTCEFEARRAARPDYYALLGCGRTAGPSDVKLAYRARALEWHPDRLPAGASAEERAAAEERFKAIGEAFEVLSETAKKELYDQGYDKIAIEERLAAAARAAREHGKRGASAGCGSGGCGGCS